VKLLDATTTSFSFLERVMSFMVSHKSILYEETVFEDVDQL